MSTGATAFAWGFAGGVTAVVVVCVLVFVILLALSEREADLDRRGVR